MTEVDIAGLVSEWYADHARDLPWRRAGTTPWAVLVSEVMLQQTPVARVEPAWRNWMARWPTPAGLAAASPGDAVRMWGRLGYPRRALRLHQSAHAVQARFAGVVPRDVDALRSLPGVGDYTARAVATFAFGQRHPVVDVNVRRVVARSALGRATPGPPSTRRDMADVDVLLPAPAADAARASIALMELGALVCTAAAPRCPVCPLRSGCAWRAGGYPPAEARPARRPGFAGTDREVRGRLLEVLRRAPGVVGGSDLDRAWPDPAQRVRALDSLIRDGLVEALPRGQFALPGHRPVGRTQALREIGKRLLHLLLTHANLDGLALDC